MLRAIRASEAPQIFWVFIDFTASSFLLQMTPHHSRNADPHSASSCPKHFRILIFPPATTMKAHASAHEIPSKGRKEIRIGQVSRLAFFSPNYSSWEIHKVGRLSHWIPFSTSFLGHFGLSNSMKHACFAACQAMRSYREMKEIFSPPNAGLERQHIAQHFS